MVFAKVGTALPYGLWRPSSRSSRLVVLLYVLDARARQEDLVLCKRCAVEANTLSSYNDFRYLARTTVEAVRTAFRGEKGFDVELGIMYSGGRINVVRANGLVTGDEGGNPVRMIGLNCEITERTAAHKALRKSGK
jgi:hypothetical protein